MRNTLNFVILLACFALPAALSAQDAPKPEKHTGDWYNIVHVDYKPGQMGKGIDIIENYFMKAAEQAGNSGPIMQVVLETGPYDAVYIWRMEDGISGMEWKVSERNIKWRKAMAELCGSDEAAGEKWQEYQSTVQSTSSAIARDMFK